MNSLVRGVTTLGLGVALTAVVAVTAQAQTRSVPVTELPEVVKQAALKDHPHGTISAASKVTKGNDVVYEVSVKDAGKTTKIAIKPDGSYPPGPPDTRSQSISPDQLPANVKQAALSGHPNGTISSATKLTKNSQVYYQVKVKDGPQTISMTIGADGKLLPAVIK
ncbi:MAG: hypothetical protein ACHQO8_00940 [Vicinamibacterales bacterium]